MLRYTVAQKVWELTTTDMCEIAARSVTHSGLEEATKRALLGDDYQLESFHGNDVNFSNVCIYIYKTSMISPFCIAIYTYVCPWQSLYIYNLLYGFVC